MLESTAAEQGVHKAWHKCLTKKRRIVRQSEVVKGMIMKEGL